MRSENFKTMSPRPRRKRIINMPPTTAGFVPLSGDYDAGQKVTLRFEEYEALKLSDYDMLTHLEASRRLGVSRPTFTRIYDAARKKIAKAFVENLMITVEGGDVDFEARWYRCLECGTVYREDKQQENNQTATCPVCGSDNVVKVQDAENISEYRWGFGRHHGRHGRRGGFGSGGFCICPKCGHKEPHTPGTPCSALLCPQCNIRLIRENSEHHKFIINKKREKENE